MRLLIQIVKNRMRKKTKKKDRILPNRRKFQIIRSIQVVFAESITRTEKYVYCFLSWRYFAKQGYTKMVFDVIKTTVGSKGSIGDKKNIVRD